VLGQQKQKRISLEGLSTPDLSVRTVSRVGFASCDGCGKRSLDLPVEAPSARC